MAFQVALTIKETIADIHSKKYLLPSIQREFIWNVDQITKLFDSLMQGYPIGSFLFWKLGAININKFTFYEFLRNYHARDLTHNTKASILGNEEITAILDGQQRLTSLYIGLMGTYTYKRRYISQDDHRAYPVRTLYLNLLKKSEDEDWLYNFSFLTEDECKNDQNHFWFRVGDILNFEKPADALKYHSKVNAYLNNIAQTTGEPFDEEKNDFAIDALSKLFDAIHSDKTISYYLEESSELDKVLKIFIRVNSGGTPLSYSDLLLSIASAQWNDLDAREEILKAVDNLNNIGLGFNIDKDFILKACLVLCDFTDISFKVDNFSNTNMMRIQGEWNNIIIALTEALTLVSRLGFSHKNITSNNLFIPIAYYIKHIGLPKKFAATPNNAENVRTIKKWFISAMLKRVFSLKPDGLLIPVRDIIKKTTDGNFPLQQIIEHFSYTKRSHDFTDADFTDNLIWRKYGQGDTLVVLSILYPWADLNNLFHVDHIFPKSAFTSYKLECRGIEQSRHKDFLNNFNYIANLQLLEGLDNTSKSDKDFKMWFEEKFSTEEERRAYCQKHLIPENVDLSFENFPEIFAIRKQLIIERLKEELIPPTKYPKRIHIPKRRIQPKIKPIKLMDDDDDFIF